MGELIQSITEYSNMVAAFNKVASGGGAPGADHVTADKFALELDKNIHLLIDEIRTSVYSPGPVAKFQHKSHFSEKVRTLSVPCVRDRVVQTAVLNVLEPLFEKLFLRCSYGYRPRKSALQAVIKTEKLCKEQEINFAFNADIHAFFDSIDTALLLEKIKNVVKEKPLINLLSIIIKSSSESSPKGISLGAPTSPLFGNIYLNDFDKLMFKESGSKYLRYADDFVMFADTLEDCEKLRDTAVKYLENEAMLTLSKEKSSLVKLNEKEGFDFLGYHFNKNGKYPSEKSLCNFSEKVNGISAEGIKNIYIDSIIEGWLNYFDIKAANKENTRELLDIVDKLLKEKPELHIGLSLLKSALLAKSYQKDISSFIIKSIKDKILSYEGVEKISEDVTSPSSPDAYKYTRDVKLDAAILSNELDLEKDSFDFISKDQDDGERILKISDYFLEKGDYEKAIRLLNRFTEKNPDFDGAYDKLSYIYGKMGLNGLAGKMKEYFLASKNEKIDDFESEPNDNDKENENIDNDIKEDLKIIDLAVQEAKKPNMLKLIVPKFLSLFTSSDNFYAIGAVTQEGKVSYSKVEKPLDKEAVISHINGVTTVGEYIVRNDNCINFAVLDIDISSEYIKNIQVNSDIYSDYLSEAFNYALFIKNTLKEKTGADSYIEFSGYKGYHVWFFFEKPLHAKNGRKFVNYLINEHKFRPHINVEIFPKENKLNSGSIGSLIKLPLGINLYTGKETYFVNDDGNKIINQFKFLSEEINRIPEIAVTRILSTVNNGNSKAAAVDLNTGEKDEFTVLLSKCQVLKYLYDKARVTKYLTHTERLSILYSIGHTPDGKDMVNYFMSLCANYDPKITLKYINKVKGSKYAISCYKIREWLSYITSQVGCNCKFELAKGEYPNILLHLKTLNNNNAYNNNDKNLIYGISKSETTVVVDEIGKNGNDRNIEENKDESERYEKSINEIINKTLYVIDGNNETAENKNENVLNDDIEEIIIEFFKYKKALAVAAENFNKSKVRLSELFDSVNSDRIDTRYGILKKEGEKNNVKLTIELF